VALQAPVHRECRRELHGPRELVRRELPTELDERERVPTRVGQDTIPNVICDRYADGCLQESDRRGFREVGERQRWEPVEEAAIVERVTHRHQQADAVGVEAPGEDPEGIGAVLVQPLAVVDDEEQRVARRRCADERQGTESGEERVRSRVVAHTERRLQRAGLRRRQQVDAVEERCQQLVKSRVPSRSQGPRRMLMSFGFRTVAHHRRGHGASSQPWDGNTMDDYADDLATVIEALDLHDVVLVRHSTGGGEVVRYVTRHGSDRVRKLVLVGAIPP